VQEECFALFDALLIVNIGRGREEAHDRPVVRALRERSGQKPAVLAVLRAQARLDGERCAGRSHLAQPRLERRPILRVHGREPAPVLEALRFAQAGELVPSPVEVVDATVAIGGADDLRNRVGEHAEAALVLGRVVRSLRLSRSSRHGAPSSTNGLTPPAARMYQAVAPT